MALHYDGFVAITDEEYSRLKRAETELKEWMCCAEQRRQDRDKAEAERDALLYNAESQYCAGMSAGFELGRNDDLAELSRIIILPTATMAAFAFLLTGGLTDSFSLAVLAALSAARDHSKGGEG